MLRSHLADRFVLIVLAIAVMTSAVPEEFQNTALPAPCAWNSGEDDFDDEIGDGDISPLDDTLFQHDHRLAVVLVRSRHCGPGMTRDWESAAGVLRRVRARCHRDDQHSDHQPSSTAE